MPPPLQQPLVFPAFIPPGTSASNTLHAGNSNSIASFYGTDFETIMNLQAQIAFDNVGMRLNDNFPQFQISNGFDTRSHLVETENSLVQMHEGDESMKTQRRKRYNHQLPRLTTRRRKNVKPPKGQNRFGRKGTLACQQCRNRNSKVINAI